MEKLQKNIYPEVKIKDVLKAFWQGVKPQKWGFFCLILAIILANIFAILTPLLYKDFFDVIFLGGDKTIVAKSLLVLILQIAILNGLSWLFYRLGTVLNISYQLNSIARLKQKSYDYLIEHSYSFFTNNFTWSLVQKVNRFARAFERLSDRLLWDLLPLLVKIILIFFVVLFINKWISLVILAWAAVFLIFNIIFSKWKLKYDIKAAQVDSKSTAYLADTIANQ